MKMKGVNHPTISQNVVVYYIEHPSTTTTIDLTWIKTYIWLCVVFVLSLVAIMAVKDINTENGIRPVG